MKPELLEAAKTFLRDLYEAKAGRRPTDAELAEWCMLQWKDARVFTPKNQTPGQKLRELAGEFPGMKGGAQ